MSYVIFKEAESWWPFKPFLKSGFSHVILVRSVCADMFWCIIDPARSHTDIIHIPKSLLSYEELTEGCTVVQITSKIDTNQTCYTIGMNSCVDVVKRILGIKGMFIITPYQLYKRLLRWDG